MFLYNLFIFFVTRQKSYAYYLLVLIFAFYSTAGNSGHLFTLLSFIDSFPIWAVKIEVFNSSGGGIVYLLFVRHLIKTKERYPKWDKVLTILIIVSVVVIGLYPLNSGRLLIFFNDSFLCCSFRFSWIRYHEC